MVGDYSNLGRDIVNHCVNESFARVLAPYFFWIILVARGCRADV